MAFLNNIILWTGLAAAGVLVPIIIHLLNRYRHRQVDWAAMELLRKALTIRSRQIRLEDVIMLILRCAAVLLIAMALARPTLTGAGSRLLGGKQRTGVLIAIDGSYSMAYQEVTSRFDKARDRARSILRTLRSGDPVTLVLMGERPRILLRNAGYDQETVLRALSEARVLAERLNLDENLEQLKPLISELKASVRECHIISDGQAITWNNLHEKGRAALSEIGKEASVFLLPASTAGAENVAITRFGLVSGAMRRGTVARYVAEVRNFGRQPASSVTVRLITADGQAGDQKIISRLEPGQMQAVPLFFRCEEGGNFALKAEISQDNLALDNVAWSVAHVRQQVRVLCVDGEPSEQAYQSETDYLQRALAPRRGTAGQSILLERITPADLPAHKPSDYHVVILANVGEIPVEQVRALRSYVEQGGGLLIFLGDRVEAAEINRRFVADGVPLLPGEIAEVVRAPADRALGWGIEAAPGGHPLARVVTSLPEELVSQARVARYFNVRLHNSARPIINIAGTQMPLLSEKRLGRGTVLLFASTADREWTDLPVHPLYPILLSEIVTHLTQQEYERAVLVGEPLVLPVPGEQARGTATVKDPSGGETTLDLEKQGAGAVVRHTGTELPGIYQIRIGKDAPPIPAAVNIDATESDVACLDEAALQTVLSGLPVRLVGENQDVADTIRVARQGRELWRVLLTVGLGVLLLESLLAQRFSRRAAVTVSAPRSTRDLTRLRAA